MRPDFDLQFLQYCDNEALRTLCKILSYDNEGKIHMSVGLTNGDSFIECYPDNMVGMWRDLASELIIVIQTVMNVVSRILVGRGVMMVGFGVLGRWLGVLFGPLGWLLHLKNIFAEGEPQRKLVISKM